jgi:beta-lactamase superfamily II metal-dependent hydrolase
VKAVRKAGLVPGSGPDAADQLGPAEDTVEDDEDDEREWEPADLLGGGVDVDALAQKPFVEDTAVPNGSSIALLAEYDGERVLLAADAFPHVLQLSVERLAADRRLRLDAFKVSHHGSRKNTSPDLLKWLDCPRFLLSSNGVRHHHPNPEAIARILKRPGADYTELVFNYRTDESEVWDDPTLAAAHGYRAEYP